MVGLAGLAYGADWLVTGASALAVRFQISPLVIGLTVVAYGTSAPEIGASLVAVLRGSPGLAVGNVIGSNAANLGLILGITAVAHPFAVRRGQLRREFWFLFAATGLLWPLAWTGEIDRWVGFCFVGSLAFFNGLSVRWSRRETGKTSRSGAVLEAGPPLGRSLGAILAGLGTLLIGADLLVRGATDIARDLGASETTIGFTLVALGTSLPELAASLAAAARGQIQMVAGNVIGSNLFNVLGALGIPAAAVGVVMEPELLTAEIPGVLLLTGLAGVLLLSGRRLGRLAGAGLLTAYAGYAAFVLL